MQHRAAPSSPTSADSSSPGTRGSPGAIPRDRPARRSFTTVWTVFVLAIILIVGIRRPSGPDISASSSRNTAKDRGDTSTSVSSLNAIDRKEKRKGSNVGVSRKADFINSDDGMNEAVGDDHASKTTASNIARGADGEAKHKYQLKSETPSSGLRSSLDRERRSGLWSKGSNADGFLQQAGSNNDSGMQGSGGERGSSVTTRGSSAGGANADDQLNSGVAVMSRQDVKADVKRKRTPSRHGVKKSATRSCPYGDGPQLYVLMTLGRSGSGSTWQIIGNLTGYETPSIELTGESTETSKAFFEKMESDYAKEHDYDNGRWILKYFCHVQEKFPKAGVVGFKWKPFNTVFSKPAQAALIIAAQSSNPTIKIVRSRRNLLDVLISRRKHRASKEKHVSAHAHCLQGDEKCLSEARAAGTGLELPINGLLKELRQYQKLEDKTDKMLKELGVPHVKVSYEKLYKQKDPEEWMRIFRFLNKGPKEGLTWEGVEAAMQHVSTSNSFHNVTLKNYREVKEVLSGSEFGGLLHRR